MATTSTATFNWSGGLSTAGTVLSTGANMYLSIQKGKLEATKLKMKADEIKNQSFLANLDRTAKMEQLELQYEQQLTDMSDQLNQAGESQMLQAMMQNRSMDSLSSVQQADQDQYAQDQAMAKLNMESGKASVEGQYNIEQANRYMDIGSLESGSKIAEQTGKIGASTAALAGVNDLFRQGAFTAETYSNNPSDKGNTNSLLSGKNYKYNTFKPKNTDVGF